MPRSKLTGQLTFKIKLNMKTVIMNRSSTGNNLSTATSAPRTSRRLLGGFGKSQETKLVARLTSEFSDIQEHLIPQAVDEADALASLTVVLTCSCPYWRRKKFKSGP